MNTATITVTAGAVVQRMNVTFDGHFDRAAARTIARANVETARGQSVEVRSETKMFRFSHVDIAQ